MEKLFGKTLAELQIIIKNNGLPTFTAKQLAEWLYKKQVKSLNDMTNLALKTREALNSNYEVGRLSHTNVQTSIDGTKKYLFPAYNGKAIESAFIPDKDRATLCVSSQVGCKMGCLFCMTGKQGFQGNLSAAEILNQIASLPEHNQLTNIVYMGMGEPFDNLEEVMKSLEILTAEYAYGMSPKRITVSTVGVLPGIKHFLHHSKCHLAVSLHSPFEDERRQLMPINNVYTIENILSEIKQFDFGLQRRVSFEYIIFKGINDSNKHIKELARILNGIKCRVNLIKFHTIPNTPLTGCSDNEMIEFRDALTAKGVFTTIRQSRGLDIYAACGLLSTKQAQAI